MISEGARILLILVSSSALYAAAAGNTVYVSNTATYYSGDTTTTLLKALVDDSVTRIVLVDDYYAGNEFNPLLGSPIPLTRWAAAASSSTHLQGLPATMYRLHCFRMCVSAMYCCWQHSMYSF